MTISRGLAATNDTRRDDLTYAERLFGTVNSLPGKSTDRQGKVYSSEGGACARRAALHADNKRFLGEVLYEHLTVENLLYMSIGTDVHRAFQNSLRASGNLIGDEIRIPAIEGIAISGIVDALVYFDDVGLFIYEFKTCGALPKTVKPEHEAQASIYSALLGLNVAVVYIPRTVAGRGGKTEARSFVIKSQRDKTEAYVRNVVDGSFGAKHGILPAGLPSQNQCGFCPFQQYCWNNPASLERFYANDESLEFLKNTGQNIVDVIYSGSKDRLLSVLRGISVPGADLNRTLKMELAVRYANSL